MATLTVGPRVIRDTVRLAALEVPGVLRVGRGGPAWRDALGGNADPGPRRRRPVHVTVWLVARPRQRLVPLTAQVRARRRAAPSSGCSAWSSAGSRSWSMASEPDEARAKRASDEEHVRSRRAGRRLALAVGVRGRVRPADGRRDPRAPPRHGGRPEAASSLARELVANVVRHRDSLDATITAAAPQYPVVSARPDGPRAAPLRPMRGATLARDAGPGGHRRMGRARPNLLRRSDATAHERRARAGCPRPERNPWDTPDQEGVSGQHVRSAEEDRHRAARCGRGGSQRPRPRSSTT